VLTLGAENEGSVQQVGTVLHGLKSCVASSGFEYTKKGKFYDEAAQK
jgi:hypothetical protein